LIAINEALTALQNVLLLLVKTVIYMVDWLTALCIRPVRTVLSDKKIAVSHLESVHVATNERFHTAGGSMIVLFI